MKRIFLLILIFTCFLTGVRSQITISNSSFPKAGDMAIELTDSNISSIVPGTAGANQVWNLSTLTYQTTDTTFYLLPSSTPKGSLFTDANLASRFGTNYEYFNKTSTEVERIGFSGDPGVGYKLDVHADIPEIVSKAGNTFNSSYNYVNTSVTKVSGASVGQPVADSVRIRRSNYISVLIDGWGTVTTPLGSFPCLRLKEKDSIVIIIDVKVFGSWQNNYQKLEEVVNYYKFIDNKSITPIVTLTLDVTNTVLGTTYRASHLSGIDAHSMAGQLISVFPNPACETLGIDLKVWNENTFVEIYNSSGRLVYRQELTTEYSEHDIHDFPPDLYLVTVMNGNSAFICKKIIKE